VVPKLFEELEEIKVHYTLGSRDDLGQTAAV
jgi:hypothetical protein